MKCLPLSAADFLDELGAHIIALSGAPKHRGKQSGNSTGLTKALCTLLGEPAPLRVSSHFWHQNRLRS